MNRTRKKSKKGVDKLWEVCYTNQAVSSGRAQETEKEKSFEKQKIMLDKTKTVW